MVSALGGILPFAAGLWLSLPAPYRERTVLIDAGGCRLETSIVEKQDGASSGTVLLFHGISANKKIMSYLARGFAEQGLRVYVPDLPGHGRTPGPFSPARAEQCGAALLRELLARGRIKADRTILAGHSMGGTIAIRVAAGVPVAGVIAISPAPMGAPFEISPEMVWFPRPEVLPKRTLIVYGALELAAVREATAALVEDLSHRRAGLYIIPSATHVSILFDPRTLRASWQWAALALDLSGVEGLPSRRMILGSLVGFFGLLLLTKPFLREVLTKTEQAEVAGPGANLSALRLFLEFGLGSLLVVQLLRLGIPLKKVGLFQGDYFASFLLLLGTVLATIRWKTLGQAFAGARRSILAAAFAGIVLLLLFSAWFDLTFSEAWLTGAKWARFPFLLLALLPYHLAEETLFGPVERGRKWRRLAVALSLRLISWSALMAGVLILHNGEILIGLLAVYLGIFNILQRCAMDIVREQTRSAAATAIFGAILLAGFCLVIFPLT